MSAVCEWQRLLTGEPMCDQPAAYRVVYDGCKVCPGDTCEGAGICVEHAAIERARATEVGLIGIRSSHPSRAAA